jgi:Secretion system C-terminal sorting domain
MMKLASKILLLLLVTFSLAGAAVWGQARVEPFVKKYESGIPNLSDLNSIWPNGNGWWGMFSKIDSSRFGTFFYGAEIALFDSAFEIHTRVNLGDTSKNYLNIPGLVSKSFPDGNGNYWYWLTGYLPSDSTRPLYYGKLDASGQILFEKAIPKTHEADYFYEFLPLPEGRGLFLNTHLGRFAFMTWLSWVDSLGNIVHQDSVERINQNYWQGTRFCTFDTSLNRILAPSRNYYFSGMQTYNMRPMITGYASNGAFLFRKDLTSQLQDNSIGSIYPMRNGGYAAWLLEYKYDSLAAYEDHRPGVVKLDSNLDVVAKKYLFPPKYFNLLNLFYQSTDGDFYLAGPHDSCPSDSFQFLDWFITKFSPDLDSLWTRFYNIGGDSIHSIQQDPVQVQVLDNGEILVLVDNSGYWPPTNTNIYYTTLYKLDQNGCLIHGCTTEPGPPPPPDTLYPDPHGGLIAYPNPTAGQFAIAWDVNLGDRSTLCVSDVAGRVLLAQAVVRGERPTLLDLGDWAAGVYLLELTSERGRVFRTRVSVLR